jgi:hypothetical protein
MLFYPAALRLSRQALDYTAGIIRRHRRQTGSPWRKLNPARQALLVLACLRKGATFAGLAAGSGAGTATAWGRVTETVARLAARSPEHLPALRDARKAGHACLVIDGTLIPIDRGAADRPFYSGKHRKHGMNLQVIASPDGDIVWVCGPLPGAVHDLTAARIGGIVRGLAGCGLVVPGDKGCLGEDGSRTPCRGRNKPASPKDAHRAHARLRAPGGRASAQLKSWAIVRKLRCCPGRAGPLAQAIHVLHAAESEDKRPLIPAWPAGFAGSPPPGTMDRWAMCSGCTPSWRCWRPDSSCPALAPTWTRRSSWRVSSWSFSWTPRRRWTWRR